MGVMKKDCFQKNAVFATIAFGCNILVLIFFLISITSFNIMWLKIISTIILLIYTVLNISLLVYNLVHVNCVGLSFNLKFKKYSLKWSEITNIEIRGNSIGRNPAYNVIILYPYQKIRFITTSWGAELFIKFCPKDKLCYSEYG